MKSQTLRTKLNHQITRAFSARGIAEDDSVLVNPLEILAAAHRGSEHGSAADVGAASGTAIYPGYHKPIWGITEDLQNADRTLCQRQAGPGGGMCNPNQPILGRSSNYLNDGGRSF